MKFKTLLRNFLIWQVVIIVVVIASAYFLPLRQSDIFLGQGITRYLQNPLLNFRSNFDGVHYVLIAVYGYNFGQHAFFPLYPDLIRFFKPWISPVLAGTLISSLAFLFSLYFLYRLVLLDHSAKIAKWTLVFILLFPTSFFFTSVYTEGLFFLFVVLSFYSARKDRWWLAGIFGFLACYTRIVGIVLLPSILAEFFARRPVPKLVKLIPIFLIPVSLFLYMNYLHRTTGDSLAFITAQKLFNQSRDLKIIMPYQVIWRYLKMIYTVNRMDFLYPTIWLEFFTGIIFLLTSLISVFKQRLSYSLFNFGNYLIPTVTGTFLSLPRFILVCFPVFILLARFLVNRPVLRTVYILVSAFFLIFFLSMFARGYWVA